ncbi:MAG: universal stress protein [Gemmataceae bacterium]
MLPIKTIVHPTDFSEHAQYAFEMACALARDHGSRILVVHVQAPAPILYGDGMIVPPDEGFREELKRRLSHVPDAGPGVTVERHLLDGDPVTSILKFAAEQQASLIVMGTHGWTGLSRLLLGSVAEKIVRRATCPVLTVKYPSPTAEQELASSAGQVEK